MYKPLSIGYSISRPNKSTENLYISNSYQRSLNPIDTRFFTASTDKSRIDFLCEECCGFF